MNAIIIFSIVLTFACIAAMFYQQYVHMKEFDRLQKQWIDYSEKLFEQHEREKNNLITALKSHTADEYVQNLILPTVEEKEEKQDDEYYTLEELANEDPDKFDKLILNPETN